MLGLNARSYRLSATINKLTKHFLLLIKMNNIKMNNIKMNNE